MNEASSCCGTTCDKAKLRADQSRVVNAFDKLDHEQEQFDGSIHGVDRIAGLFEELKQAIACLREKQ